MFKGASRFKASLGSMAILFVAFTFVGCAKKVSPVVGSEGIAAGDESSSSASSSQGTSSQGSSGQSDANKGMGSNGSSQDMASSGDGMSPSEKAVEERVAKERVENERIEKERAAKAAQEMGESEARFAQNVYFDFDKWTIRGDARDMLTENARWLVANAGAKIKIEGHGDERGTNEYNLALGERRARSTKRYLMNLGVSSSRISFISYGEEKSVCGEKTEGCFQKNRRAHFVVK